MTTSTSSDTITHWLPSDATTQNTEDAPIALCLGTGRFLRSVLVPALNGAGFAPPILIQTRGRTFLEYMNNNSATQSSTYEVDTVMSDGSVETSQIPCGGAFSLGKAADKQAAMEWIAQQNRSISILGVGVTEAGLASKDTQVMKNLYELLQRLEEHNQPNGSSNDKLCVINTDNVPNNATLMQTYMLDIAKSKNDLSMSTYLNVKISFLDSMVDRITSQRPDSKGMVPRCEPTPQKALVLLDMDGDLPLSEQLQQQAGVLIRTTPQQLETDIALKLRVCNGTHTAIAHALALLQYFQTDVLSKDEPGNLMMKYLDSLVAQQIVPAAANSQSITCTEEEAMAVWKDWRQRLVHPHFGLSSFFITQNGTAKGGIRWGPTVSDLILSGKPTTAAMAFAYAVLLRWLTPVFDALDIDIYPVKGWLDGFDCQQVADGLLEGSHAADGSVEYADRLRHCTQHGWYQFKCSLRTLNPHDASYMVPFVDVLKSVSCSGPPPNKCVKIIRAYLLAKEGGNLSAEVASQPEFENLVHAIAVFYSRMVSPSSETKVLVEVLKELEANKVGGLIGFDTQCSAMMDYYMYLSGI